MRNIWSVSSWENLRVEVAVVKASAVLKPLKFVVELVEQDRCGHAHISNLSSLGFAPVFVNVELSSSLICNVAVAPLS